MKIETIANLEDDMIGVLRAADRETDLENDVVVLAAATAVVPDPEIVKDKCAVEAEVKTVVIIEEMARVPNERKKMRFLSRSKLKN